MHPSLNVPDSSAVNSRTVSPPGRITVFSTPNADGVTECSVSGVVKFNRTSLPRGNIGDTILRGAA